MSDLQRKNGDINYRDCLMRMNWLKFYVTLPVLEGLWKKCDKNISKIMKEMPISILTRDEIYCIISVDEIRFITEEFQLDPSRKWNAFKKNSPGLVIVVFP
jgi:hypothetical protein